MGEAQWPGPSARGGIGKESPGALWLTKGPRSLNQQFGRRRLWACIHGISCVLAADLKYLANRIKRRIPSNLGTLRIKCI